MIENVPVVTPEPAAPEIDAKLFISRDELYEAGYSDTSINIWLRKPDKVIKEVDYWERSKFNNSQKNIEAKRKQRI